LMKLDMQIFLNKSETRTSINSFMARRAEKTVLKCSRSFGSWVSASAD
jgi:hypothetical protein